MRYIIEIDGVTLYPRADFASPTDAKQWFYTNFSTQKEYTIRPACKDYRVAYAYTAVNTMIMSAESHTKAHEHARAHLRSCDYENIEILSIKEASTKD